MPPIPADVRAQVRARLQSEGVRPLYAELQRTRSADRAARLMPNDRSRIARALEVVLATGRSLSDWHREGMPGLIDAGVPKVFIMTERQELVRAHRDALCRDAGGRRAGGGAGAWPRGSSILCCPR